MQVKEIRDNLGTGDVQEDVIIATCELLILVVGAVERYKDWGGKDVVYASDNQNVVRW